MYSVALQWFRDENYVKCASSNLVAVRVIPVHVNVQFAGRLHAVEEQQKHYTLTAKNEKKKLPKKNNFH